MSRPRSDVPDERMRYGICLWMHGSHHAVVMEGYDAAVSFRSTRVPATATTASMLGNTSDGAWPGVRVVADAIDRELGAT